MGVTRRLRVGVFFPRFPQSAGGGFTFEHAIFSEILSRLARDGCRRSIEFVPISASLGECAGWGVDPKLCLITDNYSPSRAPMLKRAYNKLARIIRSADDFIAEDQARRDSLIRTSVDACWSLCPGISCLKVPYIITVWDLQHRLQPFFPEVSSVGAWSWQERETNYQTIAAQAFACVVGTRRGKAELARFFGIDPSRIIINPLPCPQPISQSESAKSDILAKLDLADTQYLLYPAQFWSHKNHLCALYGLKILIEQHHPIKLVFTGSDHGSFQAVKHKAKEIGVDAHVSMPGFVSQLDLAELYRRCFALIYPSFFGPDNIPPLEAMSYGAPAIVASVPGATEQYGNAVMFFDPERPQQLADLVLQMIENEGFRRSLRQKGFDLIADLTPSNYVDRVEDFLLSSRIALECCSL